MIRLVYRATRKLYYSFHRGICYLLTLIRLKGNGVKYGKNFQTSGCPQFDIWDGGRFLIGNNVVFNNGSSYNVIGRQQPCIFIVRKGAELIIGDNTGMSSTAIVCVEKITIGNCVKIGGNTVIYDTDFHSLNAWQRADAAIDTLNTKNSPVTICDNAFIGAHTTILKGVTIGENAIVGSCSVVTKNIPANEIWAGNPAKFIRTV